MVLDPELVASHNDHRFRVPVDLRAQPLSLRRCMVIGSCLTYGLYGALQAKHREAEVEFTLFNNLARLPPLSHPAASYDFHIMQPVFAAVLHQSEYTNLAPEDEEPFAQLLARCNARLELMMSEYSQYARQGVPTFVTNFLLAGQNPMGRMLKKRDLRNYVYFVDRLNEHLEDYIARTPNLYLLDIDEISASIGRKRFQDDHVWGFTHSSVLTDWDHEYDQARLEPAEKMSAHYHSDFSPFLDAVLAEAEALHVTLRQIDSVKMVVVDLDDTLWRGVAAESEELAIQEGWPVGFMEALKLLKHRGVILAILSKNDEARIERMWRSLTRGLVLLDDFAIRKINWRPKAANFAEALFDANVLPRSVVFVDDNPVERASIAAAFPGVRVLGANPYYLKQILLWAPETQTPSLTAESLQRGETVKAKVVRDAAAASMSREEFLGSLDLQVEIGLIEHEAHPRFNRALELLNKTNQFNTTGKRWLREELLGVLNAGSMVYFTAADRFTDYGLIGVVLVADEEIVQMVMSCRVVGLDIELGVLHWLHDRQLRRGMSELGARFVETDANQLCRDLFARAGYVQGPDRQVMALPDRSAAPAHISVRESAPHDVLAAE